MYVVDCIFRRFVFSLVRLLEVQEVCLCLPTASRDKTSMYITAWISVIIVFLVGTVVLNDFY